MIDIDSKKNFGYYKDEFSSCLSVGSFQYTRIREFLEDLRPRGGRICGPDEGQIQTVKDSDRETNEDIAS